MHDCTTPAIPQPACSWYWAVPERTVMEVMGWWTTAMASRYQHVTDPIRRDVASRVGGLLRDLLWDLAADKRVQN
jgi:hypothetical protein